MLKYSKTTLFSCYVRYFLKLALGWLAMLIIGSNNKRKRAVHDLAAGTIVVDAA